MAFVTESDILRLRDAGLGRRESTAIWTLIDQTLLPDRIAAASIAATWRRCGRRFASLRVRGAPAIGIAAAYGVVLGSASRRDRGRSHVFSTVWTRVTEYLADQPAHGRQSVLGVGADEAAARAGCAAK